MAIGGVGQFPVRGDENDPRRGRRKPIDRDELIREILDEKQVVSNVNVGPTPISDKAFAALEEEEYLRSLRPEDQIETDKGTRRQRRSDELKGLRALMAGDVNEVRLVDSNMLAGKFADGTATRLKTVGDRPSIIRRSDSIIYPKRVPSKKNPSRNIQDPATRGEEILRPRDGSSYDTVLGSIQSPRSYGFGKMAGKLQDEKQGTYMDVPGDPGNQNTSDPFEVADKSKARTGDDMKPFTPVETRSRNQGYIPKSFKNETELDKVFPKNIDIDPTIRVEAGAEDGKKLGKIASDILREAKTELVDYQNPRIANAIKEYNDAEKADYIEKNNLGQNSQEARNIVGEITRTKVVKVAGQGTREITQTLPVFEWGGTENTGLLRVGNPLARDIAYLREQSYRLGLVPTTTKEAIKRKQQTISMADIKRVQSRGYSFRRLDERGASAEMVRPDGTKTLLNLLPDGSGYRISDAYRTFDKGITQLLNQPDDSYARYRGEQLTDLNTIDFYKRLSDGSWMEEPTDESRKALNNIADAIMTGKLKTRKGVVDVDPQALLAQFEPGSAALQDLTSAIRAKSTTGREIDVSGEASITNKNRAARELYENLIDYKTKMGAAMPVDLGTELIVTLGKKYNLDPTDVATSIRELPIEYLKADNKEATKMEMERKTRKRSSAQANEMTIRDPDKTYKQTLEQLPSQVDVSQARQIIPEGSNAEKYFIEKGYRRNLGTALESGDAAVTRIRDAYQVNQESSNIPQSSSINTAQASQVNAPESPVTPTTYKQMSEGLGSDVGSAEHDKAMNELMQRLLRNRRR